MCNNLFGSTVQNQNLANAQERSGYMTQAQNIANAIADRQNAAISNIYGADSMTQQNIQNAINMGVNVPPPDTLGSAYQSQADSKQSFGEGVGSSLSSMLGLATGGITGLLGGISKLF